GEPRLIGANVHSLENDEVDRRARLSEKRASDSQLKPFATLMPGKAWGSSPFGGGLATYDSRLLQLCRSSDIHGTLDATKPRYASKAAPWLPKPCPLIRARSRLDQAEPGPERLHLAIAGSSGVQRLALCQPRLGAGPEGR